MNTSNIDEICEKISSIFNLSFKKSFIEEVISIEFTNSNRITLQDSNCLPKILKKVFEVISTEQLSSLIDETTQSSLKLSSIMEEFAHYELIEDQLLKIVNAINIAESNDKKKIHGTNACTKFELTNGKEIYLALEEEYIPSLPNDLTLIEGYLILVKAGIDSRRGMLLLDKKNFVIFKTYEEYNDQISKLDKAIIVKNQQKIQNKLENLNEEELVNDILQDIANDPEFYYGEYDQNQDSKGLAGNDDNDMNVQNGSNTNNTANNNINMDDFIEFYEDL